MDFGKFENLNVLIVRPQKVVKLKFFVIINDIKKQVNLF